MERFCMKISFPGTDRKIVRVMEECRMPIVLEGPDCHWIDKENFKTDPYVLYLLRQWEHLPKY